MAGEKSGADSHPGSALGPRGPSPNYPDMEQKDAELLPSGRCGLGGTPNLPDPRSLAWKDNHRSPWAPRPTFLACTSLQANGLPRSRSREEEDWIASQTRDYLQHGLIKTTRISFFNLSY